MVKTKKYDLIFLDKMMPNMDGIATIKAIVWTTLNEKAESEPYPLSKVVQNSQYVR